MDSSGFTLIEALVTLVLLGVLAGVVFPNMSRWYEAMVARQKVSEVTVQLRQLPAVAVFLARDFALDEAAGDALPQPYRLTMPSGWRVKSSGAVRYFRTGLCQPGTAEIGDRTVTLRLQLTPLCELQLDTLPAFAT